MKYLLMYNPVSGKRKFHNKIHFIKDYFQNKNLELDVYRSISQGDLELKVQKFAKDYDVLMIAGGDGSINEVINGIMKTSHRPILATIPAGTANDVARLLGYNKNIKRTLDLITSSTSIKMDVNKLNDRYFLYATAAGILTKISYNVSRKRVKKYGYFAYLADGAKDIFRNYKMPMTVEYEKGSISGEFMLVLSLSSKRVAGMSLRKFSNSKMDDGLLEMRLIKTTNLFKIGKLILFFFSGGRKRGQDIQLCSSYYKIETTKDVVWNSDGEKAASGSIEINTLKQELNIIVSYKSKKKYFSKQ